MKAAVLHSVGDIRYENIEIKPYGDDEVKIKVKAAGICGSDPPRALKKWKYPVPAILGHEFSGYIAEVGKNVKGFKVGDRVVAVPLEPCHQCEYCKKGQFSLCESYDMLGATSFGGFAEYVNVKATNVLKIDDIDYEEAAMIEPLAVALHGVLNINPQLGDTVAVLGAGTIGQLTIQWLKVSGVERIIAVDISDKKISEAMSLGADIGINALKENPVEKIMELTNGFGVDICIECAGSKITQEQCLLVTKKKGKIGYQGIGHAGIELSEAAFEGIFRRELNIQGFWNSYSAPFPGQEWFKSIEYVKQKKIKLKQLISHRFSLEDTAKAFEMIGERKEEYNKIMIVQD
ncbi:galactitol-1-phosphate 5-dehydrogenase [Clostridium folliculivorans]|uniref:Galactitol-1-phosphate 5-dehydrogenase n=1 Tax=Clostridium folliculivorans TaxID=2886038 RepID=A0A9W5Y2N0_9CLOT|nr:galactitol-1-phosphate 5-dehydrogenase [Clostridium folliculivorans]GKU25432.1 galactitol-1-phosphate 5-dehydrogenase [Clostridium folliculivorans]GKU28454.1 galactitol-1-phosphate 5-dehydrogenase [Clostridium folliculivorans]